MRVAIAHEWLVKFAGSERCVAEMLREFPGARLLTTVADPDRMPPEFAHAEGSWLQHVPGAVDAYHWWIPIMPLSWALRRPVDDVDVTISSSHACAKGVRVSPGIPHVCYCHTPMRYAWDFQLERERFPPRVRPAARVAAAALRRWDRWSADRVTHFIANSSAVAERIRTHYGRTAEILHPPVDTEYFSPGGEREDFFLFVGRFVAYKRPDLVVEAFRELPYRVVMVGDGHMYARLKERATSNVTFERDVTPERLRDLYRRARALVYPCDEDFGIVMAEAQACGTPVIGLARGGALDIVEQGVTGVLIERQDMALLKHAVTTVATGELAPATAISGRAGRFSGASFRRGLRAACEMAVRTPVRSAGAEDV